MLFRYEENVDFALIDQRWGCREDCCRTWTSLGTRKLWKVDFGNLLDISRWNVVSRRLVLQTLMLDSGNMISNWKCAVLNNKLSLYSVFEFRFIYPHILRNLSSFVWHDNTFKKVCFYYTLRYSMGYQYIYTHIYMVSRHTYCNIFCVGYQSTLPLSDKMMWNKTDLDKRIGLQ